ncbi:MAG: DUF3106 domain-containing protein [Planctomycetes bacterium]|nr:DUF3106 domain-containing protein [Planctomycetota bacterium]
MSGLILGLLAALAVAGRAGPAQEDRPSAPRVHRSLLERFKKLTPAQKERLRERLEIIKKMTPEERRRLRENLRRFRELPPARRRRIVERFEKMTPEERRRAIELASGFFRWMHGRFGVDRFPRRAFFGWMRARHRDALEKLKQLEPGPRKDEFLKLAHEYRVFRLKQIRDHAGRHGCIQEKELQGLTEASFPEFWVDLERLSLQCPKRHPRKRGR